MIFNAIFFYATINKNELRIFNKIKCSDYKPIIKTGLPSIPTLFRVCTEQSNVKKRKKRMTVKNRKKIKSVRNNFARD